MEPGIRGKEPTLPEVETAEAGYKTAQGNNGIIGHNAEESAPRSGNAVANVDDGTTATGIGTSAAGSGNGDGMKNPRKIAWGALPQSVRDRMPHMVEDSRNRAIQHMTSADGKKSDAALREQQELADATAGTDRQIKTVRDWMEAEENRPETPEERKKRERQERSKRIIAAVSDGISALGNLFFTTQYAPNMYHHEKASMTDAVGRRLDRQKAERERKRDEYLNFSLRLGDLENRRAATVRELEAQQENRRLAREKAQRDAEAHGWMAALQPDKRREQAGKAMKAEQEAISAATEARYAPQLAEADLKLTKAKTATEGTKQAANRASAVDSYASANAHNRSNVAEFSAWDEHGHEHNFRTKDAAEAYAKQHGTWQEEDIVETIGSESENEMDGKTTSTKTRTKKGGHAGRPAPEDNTPPSRRNNNDNTPPSRR